MLLQRLREYAEERLHLPPTLYVEAPIRYVIDLDRTGRPVVSEPIDTADPTSPRTRRGQRRLVPQVQRTVAVKALLLADNAEYTFGLARPDSRPERVAACHRAYLELLDRCVAATHEPAVVAVRTFLSNPDLSAQMGFPSDFDRGATITFRVDGVYPVDLPSVQAFWAAENAPGGQPGQPAPVMQCIVCGRERPVLERLQAKLKGVPGGQTSGTAIISANADAFESYGLEASLIAPTCAECGERFTQAANALLADGSSRIVLGSSALVFWTRRDVGFDIRTLLTEPDPEQVRGLLNSVWSGQVQPEVDETAFYATVLSGSGGRAVVRDWLDTTVGEAKRHLAEWFQRQAIVTPYGEEPRPLGLRALAGATVRELQDVPPPTLRALARAALTGGPLPPGLLYQAVRRNRAEQGVTHQRAALIKLVLQGPLGSIAVDAAPGEGAKEDRMARLDPDSATPAYLCGRLLAVLEEAQRLAVPGIKATIVDRFYGTASSAPASVFGRLIRGAQAHLAKLERDKPGAYAAIQRRLEEVQSGLATFPRTLTLEEQGLFALGYYHQRAFDRERAREAKARREAGTGQDATATDAELHDAIADAEEEGK